MATLKANIGTGGNNATFMYDYLDDKLHDLFDVLPDIEKKCLNTAAYIIKKDIKDTLVQKMPAAGRPFVVKYSKNGKTPYITDPEPMVEGIKQSAVRNNTAVISARGSDAHKSGYLTRMYEHDSKVRKQKTTGRKLGKLTGVHYFETGLNTSLIPAEEAMQRIYENKITETLE